LCSHKLKLSRLPMKVSVQYEGYTSVVDTNKYEYVEDFIHNIRRNPLLGIPQDCGRISLYTTSNEVVPATTEIADFVQMFNSQDKAPFIVDIPRKKPRLNSMTSSVSSDTSTRCSTLDLLLRHLIPDPQRLFDKCKIKTKTINNVEIPVSGGIPTMLFWKLGSLASETSKNLLDRIKDKAHAVILGTSGCGKTRTVLETLCHTYGLYLTLKETGEEKAGLDNFLDAIDDLDDLKNVEPEMRQQKLNESILCLVMSRLAVLEFLIQDLGAEISCQMWLLIQLRFDFSDLYDHFKDLSHEELISEASRLRLFSIGMNKNAFPVFVDDAQISVSMYEESFPSSNNDRLGSLYEALVTAFREALPNSFVATCCTGLSSQGNARFTTLDGADCTFTVSHRFATVEAINIFISNLLPNVNLTQAHGDALLGRVRFLSTFIESYFIDQLQGKFLSIQEAIDRFVVEETRIVQNKIGGQLFLRNILTKNESVDLFRRNEYLKQFLYDAVVFSEAPHISVTADTNWIIEQAIGVFKENSSFQVVVEEPLVIYSALNYLTSDEAWNGVADEQKTEFLRIQSQLLKECYVEKMTRTVAGSSQDLLKSVLCIFILQLCEKNCELFLGPFNSFRNKGTLYVPRTDKALSTSEDLSLLEYLTSRPTAFYSPEPSAGPHLVFHIVCGKDSYLPVFITLFQNKSTFAAAMAATDPERFFSDRMEDISDSVSNASEKRGILELLGNRQHLGVLLSFQESTKDYCESNQKEARFELLIDHKKISSALVKTFQSIIALAKDK
jgi:hypothetical protein